MMFAKLLIVVDDDVDVQNLSYTAWRVLNNVDWKRDVVISEGPLDALDHATNLAEIRRKNGNRCDKKEQEEGMMRDWPEEIYMSEEIKKLVDSEMERIRLLRKGCMEEKWYDGLSDDAFTAKKTKKYKETVEKIRDAIKSGMGFDDACASVNIEDAGLKKIIIDDALKVLIADMYFMQKMSTDKNSRNT